MKRILFLALLLVAVAYKHINAELEPSDFLKVLQDVCQSESEKYTLQKDPNTTTFEEQQTIRRCLTATNVKMLANALNGPQFPATQQIAQLCRDLIAQHETLQIVDIYTAAIDEIYNFKPKVVLAAHLWHIYDDTTAKSYSNSLGSNAAKAFEVMLRAQLHLYWKFVNTGDVEDTYLLNIAYYFRKIGKDGQYLTMENSDLKRRLDKAIDSLPSSLQYLLFKRSCCLRNKEYSEHMYTTTAYHSISYNRRKIYTWYNKGEPVGTAGDWIVHITELPANNMHNFELIFSLESKQFERRYMDLSLTDIKTNYLVNSLNVSSSVPKSSTWYVQLIDNQLVFTQKDFVMCASPDVHDTNYRRFVYGYNDEKHTAMTESCQWYAEQCPYV